MRSIKSLLQDQELRGLWVSLSVHALVLLIIFIGFEFSSPETHIQPINAVQAIAIDNRSENRKRLEEQKEAQRKKEQAKKAEQEKRKQDELKKEKLKQEKIKQEQLKQEQLKQEKLKQQKAEQEQQRKKAAEDKRKAAEAKAAEAKKQLLAKQKLEAQKLAEAKKQAEAKRKAAEVARKQAEAEEFERRQQEEQRLLDEEKRQEKLRAEKAAQEAEARARQEDIDRAIYQQEIARFMTQHWIKPPNTKTGYFCEVIIMQSRGGHILDVNVIACNGGAAFKASVERAANKPDQLPLPRNPNVFESKVRILFEEK